MSIEEKLKVETDAISDFLKRAGVSDFLKRAGVDEAMAVALHSTITASAALGLTAHLAAAQHGEDQAEKLILAAVSSAKTHALTALRDKILSQINEELGKSDPDGSVLQRAKEALDKI